VNFRRITQFEIRAQRFHLIPITRILRRRLLHMRIGRRQGIHFRSRRHQRRKWREANRVRNGCVVLRLVCLRFGSLWFRCQWFGRKMRMRLPLRKRLARQRLQTTARRRRAESFISPRKTFPRRERSSARRLARSRTATVFRRLFLRTRRRYRIMHSLVRFFTHIFLHVPMRS